MSDELAKACDKLGIGRYAQHVFLCTGPKCCSEEVGMASWEALKAELKDSPLGVSCFRTKVGCLRVCADGPIVVSYPDGTWCSGMTPDRIARYVREHLVEGRPVDEWTFARNPLPNPAAEESP